MEIPDLRKRRGWSQTLLSSQTQGQVCQKKGCVVSICGHRQNPTGLSPGQPTIADPARAGRLEDMIPEAPSNLNQPVILNKDLIKNITLYDSLHYKNNIYGLNGLVSVNVIYPRSREKYPKILCVK